MMKRILALALSICVSGFCVGQTMDSLKLVDAEIPVGYHQVKNLQCVTPHGASVYEQSDMFESIMGKVVKKDFQSFSKKGDKGTILYFEFENEFKAQAFLDGLLWGQDAKPGKSEPEEYYAKGKILVIWSFGLASEIKKISKAKVERVMP